MTLLKQSLDYTDPMPVSVLRERDGQTEYKVKYVELKYVLNERKEESETKTKSIPLTKYTILFKFGMQEYHHIVKQKARTSLII